MANELTDLDLGEWSICIDPANEDCSIEIVKSKSGLRPVLKETDMSDNTEVNEGAGDAELDQFATSVLEEFDGLSAEEQAEALVGMALENAELEAAVEDATEVVKSLTENTVSKAKHDEVLKTLADAGAVIEKMKAKGHVTAEEGGGLLAQITKANGGAPLAPEAEARIVELEKANQAVEIEKAQTRAKGYGFGDFKIVADLETKIRKAFGAEDADKFVGIVKQAGGLAKASPLFKAVGEDAGNADATSPIAKANAGVAEIKKANPSLTDAQAKAKYWSENPAELARYREEQRAGAAA